MEDVSSQLFAVGFDWKAEAVLAHFQLCCRIHLDGRLIWKTKSFPQSYIQFLRVSDRLLLLLLLIFLLLRLSPLCDTGELQCLARVSFCPLLSFSCFILSSTRVLPCPRPPILLVLSSGVISSQLQEDSTPRAPAHHHQASYLCDSPEQHRVHTRCLPIPRGQASPQRPVDHRQPWTSHLQLHRQFGQHQSSHHGNGVGSGQEARLSGESHVCSDVWQSCACVQGGGVFKNPKILYWDPGRDCLLPLTHVKYEYT